MGPRHFSPNQTFMSPNHFREDMKGPFSINSGPSPNNLVYSVHILCTVTQIRW